jgi:hypothetical protein
MKNAILSLIVLSTLPVLTFAASPGFTSLTLESIAGSGSAPPVAPILSFDANDLFVNFNPTNSANTSDRSGLLYTFDFTSTADVAGDSFALNYLFPDIHSSIESTTIVDPVSTLFESGIITMNGTQITFDNPGNGWTASNGFNGFEVSFAPSNIPDATSTLLLLGFSAGAIGALKRRLKTAA